MPAVTRIYHRAESLTQQLRMSQMARRTRRICIRSFHTINKLGLHILDSDTIELYYNSHLNHIMRSFMLINEDPLNVALYIKIALGLGTASNLAHIMLASGKYGKQNFIF